MDDPGRTTAINGRGQAPNLYYLFRVLTVVDYNKLGQTVEIIGRLRTYIDSKEPSPMIHRWSSLDRRSPAYNIYTMTPVSSHARRAVKVRRVRSHDLSTDLDVSEKNLRLAIPFLD
jgi:hypothetical protein